MHPTLRRTAHLLIALAFAGATLFAATPDARAQSSFGQGTRPAKDKPRSGGGPSTGSPILDASRPLTTQEIVGGSLAAWKRHHRAKANEARLLSDRYWAHDRALRATHEKNARRYHTVERQKAQDAFGRVELQRMKADHVVRNWNRRTWVKQVRGPGTSRYPRWPGLDAVKRQLNYDWGKIGTTVKYRQA